MNEKLKSVFKKVGYVFSGVFAVIVGVILGRNVNRRGVPNNQDGIGKIKSGISKLEKGKEQLRNGLEELRKSNNDAIDSAERIDQHLTGIESGIDNALRILEEARKRPVDKRP